MWVDVQVAGQMNIYTEGEKSLCDVVSQFIHHTSFLPLFFKEDFPKDWKVWEKLQWNTSETSALEEITMMISQTENLFHINASFFFFFNHFWYWSGLWFSKMLYFWFWQVLLLSFKQISICSHCHSQQAPTTFSKGLGHV